MKLLIPLLFLLLPALASAHYVVYPMGCLSKKKLPCSVSSLQKADFSYEGNTYYLSGDSLLEITAEGVQLAKGSAWVTTSSMALTVNSKYGQIKIPENSEMYIGIDNDTIRLKPLQGEMEITPRGVEKSSTLAVGYESLLLPVDLASQTSSVTMPTIINLRSLVSDLSAVLPYEKVNLQNKLSYLGRVIVALSEAEAEHNKKLMNRNIANLQEQSTDLKYKTEEQIRLEMNLRKLFRIKSNFQDQ